MATTVHNLVYFDKLIVTCSVSMRPFSVSEIAHKTSLKALSALYNSANSFARNSAKSMTGLHCCTPLHQAVLHCAKKISWRPCKAAQSADRTMTRKMKWHNLRFYVFVQVVPRYVLLQAKL